MSRRRDPPPELQPIAKIRRANGLKKVRGLALKLIQQQLEDYKDRRLTEDEREFLLGAYRVLTAASKPSAQTPKDPGSGPPSDPLKMLGG